MRYSKGFLSGIMALILSINPIFTASASDISHDILQEAQSFDSFVVEAIHEHLTGQGIIVDGELNYSDPIALYDFESFELIGSEVIILEDNKYLGKMEVYSKEAGYTSIFDTYLPDEIKEIILTEANASFGFVNDNLLFYSSDTGYVLADGLYEYEEPETAPPIVTEIYFDNPLNFIPSSSTRSIATIELDVEIVPNETVDGRGLCVYAATAMLLNYHGYGPGLTASQLYNEAKMLVPNATGDSRRVTAVFDEYGYNVNTVKSPISAGSVATQLRNGKPLMISITGCNGGHEVVISGITLDLSTTRFTIADPNKRSMRDMYITHANPDKVVSAIDYGTYHTWNTTRY